MLLLVDVFEAVVLFLLLLLLLAKRRSRLLLRFTTTRQESPTKFHSTRAKALPRLIS